MANAYAQNTSQPIAASSKGAGPTETGTLTAGQAAPAAKPGSSGGLIPILSLLIIIGAAGFILTQKPTTKTGRRFVLAATFLIAMLLGTFAVMIIVGVASGSARMASTVSPGALIGGLIAGGMAAKLRAQRF